MNTIVEKRKEKQKATQEQNQFTGVQTMKPFEELTFSDSFLFGEVMMDENTCKDVLEIILGIEIEKVVVLEKEKQVSNTPETKSIRMDIYVKDMENTVYNVEMQVEDKKDTPKRSRYYQGLLDTKILPSGSKTYNILNKSFVIFICHYDPFGVEKCCYTFGERCLEDLSIPLGDETQKIFLSTIGKNRDEIPPVLAEFLDYVKSPATTKIKSKKIVELDNRVKQVKIDAKVRSRYMTLKNWMDDLLEKEVQLRMEEVQKKIEEELQLKHEAEKEEARVETRNEEAIKLLRKKYIKGYDIETAAEMLEMEESFVREIYGLLQEYPEYDDRKIVAMYIQKGKLEE